MQITYPKQKVDNKENNFGKKANYCGSHGGMMEVLKLNTLVKEEHLSKIVIVSALLVADVGFFSTHKGDVSFEYVPQVKNLSPTCTLLVNEGMSSHI